MTPGTSSQVPPEEPGWLRDSPFSAAVDGAWSDHVESSAVDDADPDVAPGGEWFARAWSDLEGEASRQWRQGTPEWQQEKARDLAVKRKRDAGAKTSQVHELTGVRTLSEISHAPPAPLLIDRLDPEGQTWLYGTGGAGKGTVAVSWTEQLTATGRRVLILDYEDHPTEWARRYFGLAGRDGSDRIHHVSPLAATWRGRRGPIWVQARDLRELADDLGADYFVIDSVVPACVGADPIDPATAGEYSAALQELGRPSLSLAHVTKAGDLAYPFGSVFFHNLARVTWSLVRDGPQSILTSRKANNYAPLGRFVVDTTWRDGRPVEVRERGFAAVLADRIDEVLSEPLAVAAIVARLNAAAEEDQQPVRDDSVRAALRRGVRSRPNSPQRFTVDGDGAGALWRRTDG